MLIPVETADPIVTLEEARAHLRVDFSDDDAYIETLSRVAEAAVSERLERTLGVTTWDYSIGSDDICHYYDIRLPMPPLREIVSVSYFDETGAAQTFAASNYRAVGVGAPTGAGVRLLGGSSWPSLRYGPEAMTIRFTAGYDDVPEPIRQAILLTVGQLYANRGEMVQENLAEDPAIKALLASYRVLGV